MQIKKSFAILKCMNPSCRFRFQAHQTMAGEPCPKCGASTESTVLESSSSISGKMQVSLDEYPIEILLDNIRSAYNVGAILRSADGAGAKHVHICGITPTPDHPKVQKTALSNESFIPWTQHWNTIEAINDAKMRGVRVYALETHQNSMPLFEINREIVTFPLLLVIGNEVSGIDPEILDICDLVIEIPMYGNKNSLNVSSAFSIAVYYIRQFGLPKMEPKL